MQRYKSLFYENIKIHNIDILINPSKKEINDNFDERARIVIDLRTKDIYVWSVYSTLHHDHLISYLMNTHPDSKLEDFFGGFIELSLSGMKYNWIIGNLYKKDLVNDILKNRYSNIIITLGK